MLEFLRDKALIEANPFSSAKIKKLHFLPYLNVNPSDYGGRIKHIAELQDSDLFLVVDKDLKVIDVARLMVEDNEEEKGLMSEDVKMIKCKKCNGEFEKGAKFLSHIRTCK